MRETLKKRQNNKRKDQLLKLLLPPLFEGRSLLILTILMVFVVSITSHLINSYNIQLVDATDIYDVKDIKSTTTISTLTTTTTVPTTTTATTTTSITTSTTDSEYIFTPDDIDLLASLVYQEMGNKDYVDLFIVDNDFNLYSSSFDMGQQVIAQIAINQMRHFGYSSIRETLSDDVQWYLDENVTYDDRCLKNVYAVINNETTLPDNLLYERCSETGQYTSDVYTAYNYMQSNYNSELDVYMFSMNSDGSWWMACTDPSA